jgi:hypothetical protein
MGKKVKDERLKIKGDSPPGLKLAYWFWMELGRPAQFHNSKTLLSWSISMDSLLARSGLDYERFKWFLVWLTRPREANGANYGNDYTATYLRAARDPVTTLAKHFNEVFFNFFLPHADKSIPLLMEKREREDAEKITEQQPEAESRIRFVDIVVPDASDALMNNAKDLDRLDDTFPMLLPFPSESTEDWIDRECETLRDDDWRCPNCRYAFAIDGGEDARIKFCADCEEEKVMWAQDDWEWIHDREPEETFGTVYAF